MASVVSHKVHEPRRNGASQVGESFHDNGITIAVHNERFIT